MPDQQNQLTPVDADAIGSLCAAQGLDSVAVHSVVQTESTNADAAKLAQVVAVDSSASGEESAVQVVVAATQTAGRGRLDRQWTDQGDNSLSFSFVRQVPESIQPESWGWIPLLAGLAVVTVVREHGVEAQTKWPNDVIVQDTEAEVGGSGYKKIAGILSEAVAGLGGPDQVVVGIGINLTGDEADLPVSTATSVKAAGGTNLTRESVLAEVLVEFDRLWQVWVDAGGEVGVTGLDAQYEQSSSTIGTEVTVRGASAEAIGGTATGVDGLGQLLVTQSDGSEIAVNVGDVEQVR